MKYIDNFLNKITVYRLVAYYLVALLVAAAFLGFFKILPYNPANLAFSTLLILAVCWIVNSIFTKVFAAEPNVESVYITALILALIITPVDPTNYAGVGFLLFASAWAMASKYILALGGKHIFNPAAFGVAFSAIMIGQEATWWVGGNLPLLPFVLLGGLLIVRKTRRTDLVASFGVVALITIVLTAGTSNYLTSITQTFLHSAILFFAFAMLTEPLTMPPSRILRILYGAFVGLLFAPNFHIGSLYFSPEIALLIGNIFVYFVSPKGRFTLTLIEKNEIGASTYEYVFSPNRPLTFLPGQYLEWTLSHKFPDNRGNRRYFTIASSPTENVMRLGVKFYKPTSSFKRALWTMKEHDTLSVSHVAGDFVLPTDKTKKLVFIAGGIGITPFRSMVQYLVDTKDSRRVILLYSNKTASEISYRDVFDVAEKAINMKTVYALTDEPTPLAGTYAGMIDTALIEQEIPDYKDCLFYLSGPHGMVEAFETSLADIGVSHFHIKTDYFPGFA